ncbi:MAG: AlpA family phage regulatory protein [Pseudomonadaceae bacterium]|nr:AlpA family phage regulatory protein [Pseudomonadaceae bacterium]
MNTTVNEATPNDNPVQGFMRLSQVLKLIPVSRSTWWAGVKTGRFPKALKIGPNTTVWKAEDIAALIQRMENTNTEEKQA